ncbi:MAG: glycoside hydrolase family 15 protein [Nanoarchaeota archaeon]
MVFKTMIKKLAQLHLKRLRYDSGLFAAAAQPRTGYTKSWIRDNVYEAIGFEHDSDDIRKTYHALFDLLIKHESHIDKALAKRPQEENGYIHARCCPHTLEIFNEPWGNKQNDAIGAFLFKVAQYEHRGISVIRDYHDLTILKKLVAYLASIEYWHDPDNGMWEENQEVHASSVGACVAGLQNIKTLVPVPPQLIDSGMETLNNLLPAESETKKIDLALLSLIYPYNVVTPAQREIILDNVETFLVRKRGVLRYKHDQYYNNGKEAEWVFGFPWLAKIYKDLGNKEKHQHYLMRTLRCMNWKGELPELYFGGSVNHNANTPLGWAQAMLVEAI